MTLEFQKIVNFLVITSDNKDLSKFVTKKWIKVYDQSEKNYNPNKEIRIKTSMLRSDLCDYSDAYIIVKGTITVTMQKKTPPHCFLFFYVKLNHPLPHFIGYPSFVNTMDRSSLYQLIALKKVFFAPRNP